MTFKRMPGVPSTGKENYQEPPRKPALVMQPVTYQRMLQGVDFVVEAVKPTLGPLPRMVVFEALRRTDLPEFLDDGATIARRIVQIKPRSSDVGAMMIRRALWDMHLEVGDGSTTMAVMYQSIVRQGIRYITQFGYNAMLLRFGLEKGLSAVRQHLRNNAHPLRDIHHIRQVASGMCQGDEELANILGEIFDIVGADGMIVVEGSNKPGIDREYIEGTYWKLSGWFSRLFITDQVEKRVTYEDTALLISDLDLREPAELIPILEACVQGGVKKLMILAKELSDGVIGLLVNNAKAKTIEVSAVRTPNAVEFDRVAALEDLAVLTGGRVFYSAGDGRLSGFKLQDLGRARRAWATESLFGVYGGKGDPRKVRQQIANLRGQVNIAEDSHEKDKLIERIGRLSGGTAILRLGAISESEKDARKTTAERAVRGLRKAISGGVVPGGGTVLLDSQVALNDLPVEHDEDRVACRILSRALEEPMRVIASNAGFQPDVIVEKAKEAPPGHGLDARTGSIVDVQKNGIWDALPVVEKALEIAVSGAALMMTTDVIVHLRKPQETLEP